MVTQGPTYQTPSGLPPFPGAVPTMTRQSAVAGPSQTSPTVPVQSTQVIASPTIPVNAPTREETKQAFEEVSSAFQAVSSQHKEVKAGMQALASGVEELRRARTGDVETMAQVKATLQRTLSASSQLEMRLGHAEMTQMQARTAAEEAKAASERALLQAARLKEEQQKTTAQVSQVIGAQAQEAQKRAEDAMQVASQAQQTVQATASSINVQAQETQKRIQDATQIAVNTQQKVQGISQIALQAQQTAQTTASTTQKYETQLEEVTHKMQQLENLLIDQRKSKLALERQLSAAQDRIGAAERRSKATEEANKKLQEEMQIWNQIYSQETGVDLSSTGWNPFMQQSSPMQSTPFSAPIPSASGLASSSTVPASIPISSTPNSAFSSPIQMDMNTRSFASEFLSEDLTPTENFAGRGMSMTNATSAAVNTNTHRDSFGSIFPGGLETIGQSGDGNSSNGQSRFLGGNPASWNIRNVTSTFQLGIKPKDPPVFHGRANEDVSTWISKVQDFLYLTEANSRQQVAYTATLLQEAAADWWVSLLKERNGRRPDDFLELAVLLEKRFGSSTRVDRARADLRNIRQGQSETVRSYSTRFEALLGKLPTFDKEWAKMQFIWGLHQRIAELVTIAGPSDLHAAINHAEKVEMARNLAGSGQGGQRPPMQSRGRIELQWRPRSLQCHANNFYSNNPSESVSNPTADCSATDNMEQTPNRV